MNKQRVIIFNTSKENLYNEDENKDKFKLLEDCEEMDRLIIFTFSNNFKRNVRNKKEEIKRLILEDGFKTFIIVRDECLRQYVYSYFNLWINEDSNFLRQLKFKYSFPMYILLGLEERIHVDNLLDRYVDLIYIADSLSINEHYQM